MPHRRRTERSGLAAAARSEKPLPMAEANGVREEAGAKSTATEAPRLVEIQSTVTGGSRAGEPDETLWDLLRRFVAGVFPGDDGGAPTPLVQRLRSSFAETAPRFSGACRCSGRDLLLWARRGSPLRALFLISVGTITLIALTGLLVFMLFLVAAIFNAVVVSFLWSLAVAGGFWALFIACLTAIYIGALLVAAFVISTVAISAVIGVIIATGWIGFLLIIWLLAKKSVDLAKRSASMTGSAFSAYSVYRGRHQSKKDE